MTGFRLCLNPRLACKIMIPVCVSSCFPAKLNGGKDGCLIDGPS